MFVGPLSHGALGRWLFLLNQAVYCPKVFAAGGLMIFCLLQSPPLAAENGEDDLRDGRAALDRQAWNTAIVQFKNALQRDPMLGEARFWLGVAYLNRGNVDAAAKELERAKDLGIDKQRWLLPLGKAWMVAHQFERLLQEIVISDGESSALRSDVLALRGAAYMALGEIDLAQDSVARALTLQPTGDEALQSSAQLALKTQDYARALSLADAIIGKAPGRVDGWLVRAEALNARKQFAEALAALERVLAIQPDHLAAHLGRARVMFGQRDFDQALADVDFVLTVDPDLPPANFLRAQVLLAKNDAKAAEFALRNVLRLTPRHFPARVLLGALLYEQGRPAQAEELLYRALDDQPEHLQVRKLLAATQIRLRQPGRAIDLLQAAADAPEASGDAQFYALLGNAYLQQGDYGRGEELLTKAAEIASQASVIRTQLALSRLTAGATDQDVADLENAIDLGQEMIQADLLRVMVHVRREEFDKAVTAAETLVKRRPNDPVAHNLLGNAYAAKGDDKAAGLAFEKALLLRADFHAALLNLARLDLKAKDRKTAEVRFKRVLEDDQGNLEAMLGMANLARQARQSNELLQWLDKAWRANPRSTNAGALLAQEYLARKDKLNALNIARELAAHNPDQPVALKTLGSVLLENGDFTGAIAQFQHLTTQQPDAPESWYLLASAEYRARNREAAAQAIAKALALNEKYFPGVALNAQLRLLAGCYDEALAGARQAQSLAPKQAVGFQIEGDVFLRQKDYASAASAYRAAYDKSASAQLALALSGAQYLSKDSDAALSTLHRWLAVAPKDSRVRLQLAMYLDELRHRDEALAEYEKVLEQEPNNAVALNNLAWLYQTAEQFAKGLEYAERAAEVAPNAPEVNDTLGWLLVVNGAAQRGVVVLQQAAMEAPHLPEIRYHLARAYQKAERLEEARAELESLLGEDKDFSDKPAAQGLLKQLQSPR
ncbi:MAG: XrtA/PEP-CTERM system TPR-repeat protein PrsT [Gammaproteobacteria bacterium]